MLKFSCLYDYYSIPPRDKRVIIIKQYFISSLQILWFSSFLQKIIKPLLISSSPLYSSITDIECNTVYLSRMTPSFRKIVLFQEYSTISVPRNSRVTLSSTSIHKLEGTGWITDKILKILALSSWSILSIF